MKEWWPKIGDLIVAKTTSTSRWGTSIDYNAGDELIVLTNPTPVVFDEYDCMRFEAVVLGKGMGTFHYAIDSDLAIEGFGYFFDRVNVQ